MSFNKKRSETDNQGKKIISRSDSFSVLIKELIPNDVNVRGIHIDDYWNKPETQERIKRYARQYISDFKEKTNNMPPMLVESTDDGFIVRDGDTRLRAVTMAQAELEKDGLIMEYVTVREFKKGDQKTRRLAVLKSADSKHLTTMEVAEQVSSLYHEDKMTQSEIAEEIGITHQRVGQLLKAARLPLSTKIAIQNGELSVKEATEENRAQKRRTRKQQVNNLIHCLSSASKPKNGMVTISVPVDIYETFKDEIKEANSEL